MVLQHLTYLVALSRAEHFGRAAAQCHVSQATLSAGIRRLEDELGVVLVERGHRFEGLTPEGERTLLWAQRVLADVDGMHRDLDVMAAGLAGRLRLGAIPTSLPFVPLLTGALQERHEGLVATVLSCSSRQIEQGLRGADLDAGLTYLDNEPLEGVRSMVLYRERYVLLVPRDGPFAAQESVRWRDAATLRLGLLTPDMQHRRIVDGLFDRAGARPAPILETNSISTLYAHVREGACAVMAHTWLRLFPVPEGMRAVPLREPTATHAVGLVWPDRDPQTLLVQELLAAARQAPWDEVAAAA